MFPGIRSDTFHAYLRSAGVHASGRSRCLGLAEPRCETLAGGSDAGQEMLAGPVPCSMRRLMSSTL